MNTNGYNRLELNQSTNRSKSQKIQISRKKINENKNSDFETKNDETFIPQRLVVDFYFSAKKNFINLSYYLYIHSYLGDEESEIFQEKIKSRKRAMIEVVVVGLISIRKK